MLSKRFVATCGMLAWFVASAWAGPIKDPAAQIDAGSFSNPLTGLGSFSPCGDLDPITHLCTGIIGLYNDTGFRLTSLSLSTNIDPSLPISTINSNFSCNDASSGNPFFLDCGITYDSGSGKLIISFFGVNPYAPPASAGGNDLVGAHEGIPAVPPGCLPHPDASGCTDIGHFALNFLDLQSLDNGWTDGSSDSLFVGGQTPTFGPPVYTDTATPEPGTSTLLVAGLLSFALLSRRNYFSRSSRS